MSEEKNEDIFANFKKAMEELQKAMKPISEKISKGLESTQPISEGMKKLVSSIQPFIDQSKEMAETLKRLKDWLDKNS